MKQFNLLIISKDAEASSIMLKTASKVFRKSYVLQVETLDEAYPLLRRLNINLLLVDMDGERINFPSLNQGFPELFTIGMTGNMSNKSLPADPIRNRLLSKQELKAALTAELKAIRKDKGFSAAKKPAATVSVTSEPADFKNFVSLVAAS